MYSKKTSFDIAKLLRNEKIDDVSLTIYYVNPFILTRYPWSVDHLINYDNVNKIIVNGSDLGERLDLFNQIDKGMMIPVKKRSSYSDIRLYYVLESKKNGKLVDVAMWGGGSDSNSIFVNELEVNGNDVFYDIIHPFLPEDAIREFEKWHDRSETL